MFKAAIGHSEDPDSREAITEVLAQCQQGLAGEIPQAGILLAAIDFDYPLILAQIQETFPGLQLVGCSTNGEISSVSGFQEDSLTLMVFSSDQVTIRAGLGRGLSKNIDTAVQEAIDMASIGLPTPPKLCFAFPEGLCSDTSTIVQTLQQKLGQQIPIFGGMSADNLSFQHTYQFFQGEVTADAIPLLLFSGNICYSHGTASGWQLFSKKSQVTKADDCIVYEINDQPALDFYKQYLGAANFHQEYMSYPLAIFENNSDNYYLRTPVNHDEESGAVTFIANVPLNSTIQIAKASRAETLQAAAISLEQATHNYPGQLPAAALLISCASRRMVLGTRTKEEYETFQTHFPKNIPCSGFYSYGEIAPLQRLGKSQFHNQTFITILFGEGED
jgi:hypothetical protein